MISFPTEEERFERIRRGIFLSLFTALALAIHTVEALLPSPAPWFRLGFANILTVAALFLYGGSAAWSVTMLRIGIGSLFLGTLFSPGFFLSLSGGIFAVGLMSGAKRVFGRLLGPVGVSALGAAGHAFGQILLARLLIVRHDGLWYLLPWFIAASLVTGVVNGVIASYLLERMQQRKGEPDAGGSIHSETHPV